jgi:hypothetical protein
MSFGLYLTGYISQAISSSLLVWLLTPICSMLPMKWIGVGLLVMIGLGIRLGVRRLDKKTHPPS